MGTRHRIPLLAAVALAGGVSFPDPAGDVRGGPGPDLVSVSVAATTARVTFRFRFTTAPPLGRGDVLLLGIDVPPRSLKRGSNGWTGLDFYAGLHANDRSGMLVRAVPGARGKVLARPGVVVAGRTLAFSVTRAALGNPSSIDLVVAAGREADGGGSDEVPDRGTLHFECHFIDVKKRTVAATTAGNVDVARIDGRWLITNFVGSTTELKN